MTADERKHAVLAVALKAFARDGYGGTSTEAIAAAAGISQPYLFRLFGTKKQLFLETVALGCRAIVRTFDQASEGLEGEEALAAMGSAYAPLITDRDVLLIQLQGYASSGDPEVRAFTSDRFREIVEFVAARTGLGPQALREFFAMGMLCNVITALDLGSLDELWGDWRYEPEHTAFVASLSAARQ
jgi:AcrR family transcriptional regulator